MTQQRVFTGPTDLILSAIAPERYDAHMKDWRWELYTRGITVDRFGRLRDSRTGELR